MNYKMPFSFISLLAGNQQAIAEFDIYQSLKQNIDCILLSPKGKSRYDPLGFGNPLHTYSGGSLYNIDQKTLSDKLELPIKNSIERYEKRLTNITVKISNDNSSENQQPRLKIMIEGRIKKNRELFKYSEEFPIDQ